MCQTSESFNEWFQLFLLTAAWGALITMREWKQREVQITCLNAIQLGGGGARSQSVGSQRPVLNHCTGLSVNVLLLTFYFDVISEKLQEQYTEFPNMLHPQSPRVHSSLSFVLSSVSTHALTHLCVFPRSVCWEGLEVSQSQLQWGHLETKSWFLNAIIHWKKLWVLEEMDNPRAKTG